jgi:hypothetical protein
MTLGCALLRTNALFGRLGIGGEVSSRLQLKNTAVITDFSRCRAGSAEREARPWDVLHAPCLTKQLNGARAIPTARHAPIGRRPFLRFRRAQVGIHHATGPPLATYPSEVACRENSSRIAPRAVLISQ